ncbi:adenylosuccinate lyase [Aquella oligotrophica]|uniref:Adenylosuccinate lyase n=1 Tax=Aquella oligotrophica TaxID=2067065 RepID=A0A2I7N644_9NEIS|nr:adenylosuccinate lyase [Aquella oligotrophica]AUR51947.1 adenylosuccinate lyase [Aquella oligotrophica]
MSNIFAISPLDGRYADKVKSLNETVSEFGLIKYRVMVEIEWFKFLFSKPEFGLPSLEAKDIELLDSIVNDFNEIGALRVKEIEATTNHDVKAVEYYIKEKIAHNPDLDKYREFIHFACTSEDINNTSYGLMLKDVKNVVILPELSKLQQRLTELADQYRDVSIMCRTHGQPATPSTMGKELYNVVYRLERQIKQLEKQEILAKINGAVGNYNAHLVAYPELQWDTLAKEFIELRLGLHFNPYTTQIEPHDYQAEIYDNLRRINTILIDLSRDMWSYISINYFKQKVKAGEVGSSTMPHKVNPIDFENAEGNFGLANSVLGHLSEKLPISRWQRDLTDSTVQRNIGVGIGYTLLGLSSLLKGLGKVEINLNAINHDLDNNWELLAEPIQTVMRKCNVANAYEQLKELTRGKKVNAEGIKEFVAGLDLPDSEKTKLASLTPHNYIGLANKLY